MKFKGTIIITDPCYVIRAEHHGTKGITENDWDYCDCGDSMEKLGINIYMTESTEYGDWSCTTFKGNIEDFYTDESKEHLHVEVSNKLGQFCADAGLVSVFLLDEVKSYNPDVEEFIKKHPWCFTTINDFDGDVEIKSIPEIGVSVIGKGNINFFTFQTGF